MDVLGQRIHDLRVARHLGLRELADQAGVDPGQLSRLERGQAKRPGHQTLSNLAGVLEVDLATLTGGAPAAPIAERVAAATVEHWLALVAAIDDMDVERHLRTLARLSPAARAEIVTYTRWRSQQEQATGPPPPRTYHEPAGDPPRILGDPPDAREERAAS